MLSFNVLIYFRGFTFLKDRRRCSVESSLHNRRGGSCAHSFPSHITVPEVDNQHSSLPFQEIDKLDLNEPERDRLKKHFALIRSELEVDSDELRLRNQLSSLEEEAKAYETKLTETEAENESLLTQLEQICRELEGQQEEEKILTEEIEAMVERERHTDTSVLDTVQSLIQRNERMKQEEQEFKESCRSELADLERTIEESERHSPHGNVDELQRELQQELETLQSLRIQAAKQNRQLTSVQRQLDNIPDRTELAQYQKRFLELYNQVSAKHRETKQFFSLYNTLSQTKTCLDKELSLLNSIFDSYQL